MVQYYNNQTNITVPVLPVACNTDAFCRTSIRLQSAAGFCRPQLLNPLSATDLDFLIFVVYVSSTQCLTLKRLPCRMCARHFEIIFEIRRCDDAQQLTRNKDVPGESGFSFLSTLVVEYSDNARLAGVFTMSDHIACTFVVFFGLRFFKHLLAERRHATGAFNPPAGL